MTAMKPINEIHDVPLEKYLTDLLDALDKDCWWITSLYEFVPSVPEGWLEGEYYAAVLFIPDEIQRVVRRLQTEAQGGQVLATLFGNRKLRDAFVRAAEIMEDSNLRQKVRQEHILHEEV